jgi:hypothetical protein
MAACNLSLTSSMLSILYRCSALELLHLCYLLPSLCLELKSYTTKPLQSPHKLWVVRKQIRKMQLQESDSKDLLLDSYSLHLLRSERKEMLGSTTGICSKAEWRRSLLSSPKNWQLYVFSYSPRWHIDS